eukprot:Phypoly_transcript_16999.p1 GENE.Phypoly_transcript_16999~~Phypoly_transcript_16999.p1  ORF type:complete len:161 (+),score=24.60 Phypoly_transcript_16999:183-665(+)
MMEFSLPSASKLQQPSSKSHRAKQPIRVAATGVATSHHAGAGSGNGISGGAHTAMSKSSGVCGKCGCKKRHSRTCPYKKKGEDDDDMIEAPSNASALFCYLDVVALKRYKKHYRLKTKQNSTKAELAHAVRLHFENINVNEGEVIDIFLMKVRTGGSPTL